MAYNKSLGYDPDLDYSEALLQQGLTAAERARLTSERQAKINGVYGGVEPAYGDTGHTFTQLYGTALSQLPTPSSFRAEAKPAFSGAYTQDVADLWDAVKNYGSFDYSNKNMYQQALDKAVNRDPFSYDAASDPLYGQYRKEYTREGNRAMEDTLGAAAAMSGGRASSWANTAAAQARNYYAAQMTDKIPELYQLALQKYLAEAQLDQSGLAAMQADRSAEQSEWRGNYDVLASKANTARELENTNYSRYLDELGQWNTDRNFSYSQLLDEIANQQTLEQRDYERQRTAELDALDRAAAAARYGDYSGLNAQGITPDTNNVLALALANAGRASPVGAGTGSSETGSKSAVPAPDPWDATGQIDAKTKAMIDSMYPNGIITDADDWSYLLSLYSEATLRAAGYTPGAQSAEAPANTAKLAKETVASFGGLDVPDTAIKALLDAGATEQEIRAAGYTGNYFTGDDSAMMLWELKNDQKGYQNRGLDAQTTAERLVTKLDEWEKQGKVSKAQAEYLAKQLGY